VFAAQEAAAHVAFTVAALAGGVIVELVSPRGAFAVAAGCAAVAAPVAGAFPQKQPLGKRPVENR
jgi:hypothetical protein